MYETFSAVKHMHEVGIVHRDLKPENILIDKDSIKIIDFGLARRCSPTAHCPLESRVGTPSYMAPEVIAKHYSSKCDEWSCGVITYFLLSGGLPFHGCKLWDVFNRITEREYSVPLEQLTYLSKEAKNFIQCLLRNEKERMTAAAALRDTWLQPITECLLQTRVDTLRPAEPPILSESADVSEQEVSECRFNSVFDAFANAALDEDHSV